MAPSFLRSPHLCPPFHSLPHAAPAMMMMIQREGRWSRKEGRERKRGGDVFGHGWSGGGKERGKESGEGEGERGRETEGTATMEKLI
eukprot:2528873-Rhodomonas_salina.1